MKNKLILLLILVLLFVFFIYLKFFVLNKKNNYGQLKIVSSPQSSVFINGLNIGQTTFDNKYKVGEYVIKLIPDGVATETASWQGKIKVFKNTLTYVNRELGSSDITSAGEIFSVSKVDRSAKKKNYGEIYVDSDPQGAIVYLDNEEKGIAPLILSNVLKGEHEISVFMPGFFRRNQKVNVNEGYRINASFKLAIDQTKKSDIKVEDVNKEASPEAKKSKTYVLIKETELGYLRVREEPTVNSSESGRVKPGEKYDFIDEKKNWYKIKVSENKEGWVYSQYAEKKEI